MALIGSIDGSSLRGRSLSPQLATDGRSSYRIVHQAQGFPSGPGHKALIPRERLHRGKNPTAPASFP